MEATTDFQEATKLHIHDISSIHVDTNAINTVPESIARETCILPVSLGEDSLHILHPVETDPSVAIDKLEFILNRTITFDTCDRHAIEAAISHHYQSQTQEKEERALPASLPPIEADSEFSFLDLIGTRTFRTSASISFHLGHKSDHIQYSDGSRHFFGKNRVFNVVGWLDVHYPCEGFHKLQIRCSLPDSYVRYESMRDLVFQLCEILCLPVHTPYKIHLQAHGLGTSMEDPQGGFV